MYPKIEYDGQILYWIEDLGKWCLPIEDLDKVNYIIHREYVLGTLKERIQEEVADIIINSINDKMKGYDNEQTKP